MSEYGVNLRCPGMNMLDLGDLVAWLPRDSALIRSAMPDEWEWDVKAQLAALLVDSVRHAEWSATLGNPNLKGTDKRPPKPIPRPGVEPDDKTFGGRDSALPMDEMAEWLGGPFALNN